VRTQVSFWSEGRAGSGTEYRPVLSFEYGSDLGSANQRVKDFALGTKHQCFYNPDNTSEVIFDRGYTWWKWFLTAFPTLFLFMMFCAGTAAFLAQGEFVPRSQQICGLPPKAAAIQWALWVGFLLPICFFLPLWSADLPADGKDILVCFITSFAVLGWFPIAHMQASKRGMSKGAANFVYFFMVTIPIGVLIPIASISNVSSAQEQQHFRKQAQLQIVSSQQTNNGTTCKSRRKPSQV
jgi:hypothetical protein